MIWAFLTIYVLSAMAAGAINWATYRDTIKNGHEVSSLDKVAGLYIIPLCPVANSLVCIGMLMNYFG